MLPTDFLCRQEVALCVCTPMLVDDSSPTPPLVQFFSCCLLSLIKHNGFVYLLVLCVGFWVMESYFSPHQQEERPTAGSSLVHRFCAFHYWFSVTSVTKHYGLCFKPHSCCCSCGAPYCDEVTSTQNSPRPL